MKLTVYNFAGGVGKSSLAAELALVLDYQIITNDIYTPLRIVFDKDSLLRLKPEQKMPDLPENSDVIFDLGGYPERRAVVALEQSDLIMVPTLADTNRLNVTISSIKEIKKYNNKITVIVNFAGSGDLGLVKEVFSRDEELDEIPIFEIKKSRSISNIISEKKSVHSMILEGGLKKYHFQPVEDQFNRIIRYLLRKS